MSMSAGELEKQRILQGYRDEYEALRAKKSIKKFVELCRKVSKERPGWLSEVLCTIYGVEEMLLNPTYLKALHKDDYGLFSAIRNYCIYPNDTERKIEKIEELLRMRQEFSDRIRALLWFIAREIGYFGPAFPNLTLFVIDEFIYIRKQFPDILMRKHFPEATYAFLWSIVHRVYWEAPFSNETLFLNAIRRTGTPRDFPRIDSRMPETMRQALKNDSVSLYEIELTMSGKRLSKTQLFLIIKYKAANILCHLLRTRVKALTAIITPQELLCLICRYPGPWVPVLDTLEEMYPGISKNTTDIFHNNPLWHCLYHKCYRNCELEEALIKYGCDPDARNFLDLSYNICKDFRGI